MAEPRSAPPTLPIPYSSAAALASRDVMAEVVARLGGPSVGRLRAASRQLRAAADAVLARAAPRRPAPAQAALCGLLARFPALRMLDLAAMSDG